MARVLSILLFTASTVSSSSTDADHKDFCTFLAKQVFTAGEYTVLEEFIGYSYPGKPGWIKYEDMLNKGDFVEYEEFEMYSSPYLAQFEHCVIQAKPKGENVWHPAVELYFGDFVISANKGPNYKKTPRISPVRKDSNSVKLELLGYLENVNWSEIANSKELRMDFKNFWTTEKITGTEKKEILKECAANDDPGATKKMMECIKKSVEAPGQYAKEAIANAEKEVEAAKEAQEKAENKAKTAKEAQEKAEKETKAAITSTADIMKFIAFIVIIICIGYAVYISLPGDEAIHGEEISEFEAEYCPN